MTIKNDEKVTKAEGTTQAEGTATQQPVAQGTPVESKKEGWFTTHIVNPIRRNKKVILAGLGGVAAGAAGTVAYGYFAGKAAEKRQSREQVYIQPTEEVNPLDPNV